MIVETYKEILERTDENESVRISHMNNHTGNNAFKCNHCNTIITSYARHDYQSCECESPKQISIDGGFDYLRGAIGEEADYDSIFVVFNEDNPIGVASTLEDLMFYLATEDKYSGRKG